MNLPELPDDYFWRIRYWAFGMWRLELRRRHKVWFSTQLDFTPLRPPGEQHAIYRDWESYVLDQARRMYRERSLRIEEPSLRERYFGDYPPKPDKEGGDS